MSTTEIKQSHNYFRNSFSHNMFNRFYINYVIRSCKYYRQYENVTMNDYLGALFFFYNANRDTHSDRIWRKIEKELARV